MIRNPYPGPKWESQVRRTIDQGALRYIKLYTTANPCYLCIYAVSNLNKHWESSLQNCKGEDLVCGSFPYQCILYMGVQALFLVKAN